MTTDALNALFALLETDEDDFATLMQRFGIDPASDLQNSDLTNVDFGDLKADTLNLTGSSIEGANLSRVKCKKIIGPDGTLERPKIFIVPHHGAAEPILSRSKIEGTILAISKYQKSSWLTDKILDHSRDTSAPVLAFYDTAAEQDFLTKRLCAIFNDVSHPTKPLPSGPPPKFIWFYSKADKSTFELSATVLERNFFALLRSDNTSDDIGVYPYLSNRAVVAKIRNSLQGTGNSPDRMRDVFSRELNGEFSERGGTVLFSGYPPISKRFYEEIRKHSRRRVKLIFLCSSNLEKFYNENRGVPWRRAVVPAYSAGQPLADIDDLVRIRKRIETSSQGTISIGADFEAQLIRFVGKPLFLFKKELTNRLAQIASRLPSDLPIHDIVL